jgi:transaldolase
MIAHLGDLKVKIFADGADKGQMLKLAEKPFIAGLTTNPTLMRKAGISNYEEFAKDILLNITNKPISFEVFTDEISDMKVHGKKIASWGENVFVKIPVTNTRGESTHSVIKYLSDSGVKVNVTAVMTNEQVTNILDSLNPDVPSCISIFAGRIADTGIDPVPILRESLELMKPNQKAELIWASPRELLNIIQADELGCHIITATSDILAKIPLIGKNLDLYSLETVCMFASDAHAAGYHI